jgi:hypothetical protein
LKKTDSILLSLIFLTIMIVSLRAYFQSDHSQVNSNSSQLSISITKPEAVIPDKNLNIYISCFISASYEIDRLKTRHFLFNPKIRAGYVASRISGNDDLRANIRQKILHIKLPGIYSNSDPLPA